MTTFTITAPTPTAPVPTGPAVHAPPSMTPSGPGPSTSVTSTPTDTNSLPTTGPDVGWVVAIGLAVILLGAVILIRLSGRRRV